MTSNLLINTFDGGTNGTNISVANSGGASGDAFDTISTNGATTNSGSSTITYATLGSGLGVKAVPTANTYLRQTQASPLGNRAVATMLFYFPGTGTAAHTILRIRSATADSGLLQVNAATGKVLVQDATSTTISASTSAYALVTGWYRIQFGVIAGTTTTNGTLEYRIYNSSDALVGSWSSNAVNSGTTNPSIIRYYVPVSGWGETEFLADSFGFMTSDTAGEWIPLPGTTPPVATGANTNVSWVDFSGSTGSAPLTLSISQLTGPIKTATQVSSGIWRIPLDTSSQTTWRVTVAQADSQTSSKDITIPALTTTTSLPVQQFVLVSGSWV